MCGPGASSPGARPARMYRVILAREADRAYTRADAPLARKLARCFEALEIDPRAHTPCRCLHGLVSQFDATSSGEQRLNQEMNLDGFLISNGLPRWMY